MTIQVNIFILFIANTIGIIIGLTLYDYIKNINKCRQTVKRKRLKIRKDI